MEWPKVLTLRIMSLMNGWMVEIEFVPRCKTSVNGSFIARAASYSPKAHVGRVCLMEPGIFSSEGLEVYGYGHQRRQFS